MGHTVLPTCTVQLRRIYLYLPFLLPNEGCLFPYINPDCKSYRRGLNWLHKSAVTCVFAAHYHHLQVTFLPTCRSRDVITTIFVIILSPAELRQIFVGVCINQNAAHSEGHKSVGEWHKSPSVVAHEPTADTLPLKITVRASVCSEDGGITFLGKDRTYTYRYTWRHITEDTATMRTQSP